jgi:hypothetical protein
MNRINFWNFCQISYTVLFLLILSLTIIQCSDSKTKKPIEKINPLTDDGTPLSKERCNLQPDPGPCKALIIGYYYDHSKTSCQSFNYGGCQGSLPFRSLENCEKTCP